MELHPKNKLLHMMHAIEDRYPRWYASLGRDFNKGILTWELFEEEVIKRADVEENGHRIQDKAQGPSERSNKGYSDEQVGEPRIEDPSSRSKAPRKTDIRATEWEGQGSQSRILP
ncbi:hypothetical protein F4818DRAFT_439030 [Hypoxylon cercidicola]|nr:hypothetical protein F4818DRAFT_439030 [Hypoxylon cercidicola]